MKPHPSTPRTISLTVFLTISFLATATSQEMQVPLDEEGKIELIDHELDSKLLLFRQISGFEHARLFQLPDTSFVLETWYHEGGRKFKTREVLSTVQAGELRRKISERIRRNDPAAGLNQEGRSKLVGAITGLSLGFYGWAIPTILKIESASATFGTYLLIGAGGFFLPYSATQQSEISDEAATFFIFGSSSGIAHGFLFHNLVFGNEATFRGMLVSSIAFSIAEGAITFNLASKYKMSAGRVEVIGSMGDLGFVYGTGFNYLSDLSFSNNRRAYSGSIIAGSALGVLAGAILTADEPYTRGDANILRTSSVLGAYLPMAALGIAGTVGGKRYATVAMIGGAVGTIIGHSLLKGKDFTTGQGVYVSLGAVGGGLVGLAFPVLVQAQREVLLSLSSIGAVAGFVLMYQAYAPLAEASATSSSFQLRLHPESLLSFTERSNNQRPQFHMPLVSLQYHF